MERGAFHWIQSALKKLPFSIFEENGEGAGDEVFFY
jgi:hypothetical protein